jgi:hypothetical protein
MGRVEAVPPEIGQQAGPQFSLGRVLVEEAMTIDEIAEIIWLNPEEFAPKRVSRNSLIDVKYGSAVDHAVIRLRYPQTETEFGVLHSPALEPFVKVSLRMVAAKRQVAAVKELPGVRVGD